MRKFVLIALLLPQLVSGQLNRSQVKIDSLKLQSILSPILDTMVIKFDSVGRFIPCNGPDEVMKVSHKGFSLKPAIAAFNGILDAIKDVQHCRLVVKVSGREPIIRMEDGSIWYFRSVIRFILKTKYSIDQEVIKEEDDYINYQVAYDEISNAVINQYYGFDACESVTTDIIKDKIRIEGKYHPEWRASQ